MDSTVLFAQMYAEPYQQCRSCGAALENTTMYKRHALCRECRV